MSWIPYLWRADQISAIPINVQMPDPSETEGNTHQPEAICRFCPACPDWIFMNRPASRQTDLSGIVSKM